MRPSDKFSRPDRTRQQGLTRAGHGVTLPVADPSNQSMMIPDALLMVRDVCAARAAAGSMLLGLDFDGTLAPIVPRPDDATLPPATRTLLGRLAARGDTQVALISGRGLEDLAGRVGLAGLFYAGNHGLEIEGPNVRRVHDAAAAARARLGEVARRLAAELGAVDGAIVEDKGLTLSVHYRMVPDAAAAARVREAAHAACAADPALRVSDGRKVVEIRPAVDWHKGRALAFLRETLTADAPGAPVLFVGDDRTDEDAFRVLGDDGWGIVVGDPPPADTAARAMLRSTDEVIEFLRRLA
jgi:trehalose 6-phosphate phosphatase